MPNVKHREGAPYSLFCYDCGKWIPNTANYEMQKEGVYSHSHNCYKENDKGYSMDYYSIRKEVESKWPAWKVATCNSNLAISAHAKKVPTTGGGN